MDKINIPEEMIMFDSDSGIEDIVMPLDRTLSKDSLFGRVFDIRQPSQKPYPNIENPSVEGPAPQVNVLTMEKGDRLRKQRDLRKQKKKDYRKNICGYITKKIIREFTGDVFTEKIDMLCKKQKVSTKQCQKYYHSFIEKVTGPSHLGLLFMPESPKKKGVVRVFQNFFEWFLKERYLRYLLSEGKMENKAAYINYKNDYLLHLIREIGNVEAEGTVQPEQ